MKSENYLADDELKDLSVSFVLAMMRSASTDKIQPKDWWTRAASALKVSATSSESFSRMVSRFLAKIQSPLARMETTEWCVEHEEILEHPDNWRRFRDICGRESAYVVAKAQMARNLQREEEALAKKAKK